jgi:protocatechuate 4,5-dioxygenase beta chain
VARIIGGIGTSHVPTIGLAIDRGKQHDPDWAPLFAGYAPVAKWLAERQPDVLVYFYNDHATTFHFDHYPTFALGVGERFAIADEGLGPRKVPPIRSHPALARHLAQSLVYDEFDLAVFQDLPLDHGCNSPLTMLWRPSPTGRDASCRLRSTCSSIRCRRRCAATSSAGRCAARSSRTPRTSRWPSSAPAASPTR